MLEPIYYNIGRSCKETYFKKDYDNKNENIITPKLIDDNIIKNIKSPLLKIPFDAPEKVANYIFEQNKDKIKGTIKLSDNDSINYYILNLGKYIEKINDLTEELKNTDLIIIADGRRLINRKELLLISELRNIISPNTAIYFPTALPNEIPLLTYMGVDYFDNSSASYYASKGYKFTKNRMMTTTIKFNELIERNEFVIKELLEETKYCIKDGSLRNLVEETSISNPYLRGNYKRFNPDVRNIPLSSGKKIIVSIDETTIPEVKKYIERLGNYEAFTNIIVLLPCSSKKPYSFSKSHQYFINSIRSSNTVVEEVVLTSPYGVVPRALEGIVNYDIPVVGAWSSEEIEFINKHLKTYLDNVYNKFGTITVIAHLPEHYYEILDKNLIEKYDIICTVEDNKPTSNNSLATLKDTLKEIDGAKYNINDNTDKDNDNNAPIKANRPSIRKQVMHNYQQLAKFQFGSNFIPDDTVIKGRHKKFFAKLNNKLTQICSLNYENGLFVLTYDGGKLLGKNKWVEVNFKAKKGSLFAPGFKDCDETISVGDEIVIIYEDEILGVGRASMSGAEMKKARNGALLNIRHCKK
jgi:archaeosine synthase